MSADLTEALTEHLRRQAEAMLLALLDAERQHREEQRS